jgi:hypothetical protein
MDAGHALLIIAIAIMGYVAVEKAYQARFYTLLREQCEKELPRNQYCKVIAVPIPTDKDNQ